jgi:hypothetical protein
MHSEQNNERKYRGFDEAADDEQAAGLANLFDDLSQRCKSSYPCGRVKAKRQGAGAATLSINIWAQLFSVAKLSCPAVAWIRKAAFKKRIRRVPPAGALQQAA